MKTPSESTSAGPRAQSGAEAPAATPAAQATSVNTTPAPATAATPTPSTTPVGPWAAPAPPTGENQNSQEGAQPGVAAHQAASGGSQLHSTDFSRVRVDGYKSFQELFELAANQNEAANIANMDGLTTLMSLKHVHTVSFLHFALYVLDSSLYQ